MRGGAYSAQRVRKAGTKTDKTDSASLEGRIDEFVTALRKAMSDINVNLNKSTSVFSRQPDAVETLSCGIGIDTNGAKILGVPIGDTEFVQSKARKRLRASFEQMRRIPELETMEAIKLLRVCVNQRPLFLACMTHADDFVPVAEEWDAAMRTCLLRITQSDELNRRWFLKCEGGLGITELAKEAPALRYKRYIQTKLTIVQCLPRELSNLIQFGSDSAHPYHQEVFASYNALPEETRAVALHPEDDPRDLQPPDADSAQQDAIAAPLLSCHQVVHAHLRQITGSLKAVAREQWLGSPKLSDKAKLQLLQSAEPGAAHWIADHYTVWRAVMSMDAEARYAIALWMGDNILQLEGSDDPTGRSILHEAHKTGRHEELLDLVCDIAIECGATVRKGKACSIFGDGRRVDVVIQMPRSGKLYALDVTVVDGSADACVEHAEAFTSVTRAVEEREQVKREHYSVS